MPLLIHFTQVNSAYRLANIEVSEGSYCSKWKLKYDHYASKDSASNKPETFRLRLIQVQQIACDESETIPPYKFEYNGPLNSNGTAFLPNRLSKAIDHWGFYNGAVQNQSSDYNIPSTTVDYGAEVFTKGESNRTTSPDSMKFGILNKMVYPTGGVTYFNYEANTQNELLSDEDRLLYLENCDDFEEDCCGAPDQSGTFTLFTDYTQTIYANRPKGGLRVTQIRVSPDSTFSSNDIIRTFKYRQAQDSTKSSGILRKTPNYGNSQYFSAYSFAGYYVHFQGTSIAPMSDFEGISIGYSRVEEFFNGNGKRVYNYHMSADPSDATFPVSPSRIDPRIGNLKASASYTASSSRVDSLNNTPKNYDYDFFEGTVFKVRDLNINCNLGGGELGPTEARVILDKEYFPRTDFYYLTKVEQEIDGVTTSTHYTYDTIFSQPKSIAFANSDGDTTKIEFKYTFNLADGATKSALLNDYYLVLPPLRDSTLVDNVQVGGSAREYAFFDSLPSPTPSSNRHPYIQYYYTYEMTWNGSTPNHVGWNITDTLHKVDVSNGLPVEFSQRGWQKEIFTWDDNNLIKTRKYEDFEWRYSYHSGTGLVDSIIDIDGQFVRYEYDKLMRLSKTRAKENNVITDYSYDYRVGGEKRNSITSSTTFTATDSSDLINRTTVQYLDGIGRPIQTVEKAYSPNSMDVVKAIEYDKYSRPFKIYEPFESSNSNGDYVGSGSWPGSLPYVLTEYETSPLNRQISVTPPNWYPTTTSYDKNTGTNIIAGETYPANTLRITTVTDPNNHKTLTWSDRKGRTVAVQRIDSSDTYYSTTQYAYDTKDRLTKVLVPGSISSDSELIYTYSYDERDNILNKKIPDQDAISYLYDVRNLMTYMQDGNMTDQGRWLHIQYDDYGRAIESGFVTSTPGSGGEKINFTESLTKTCYDGCDFVGAAPDIYLGKVRRSETRILGTPDWLQTTFTYDSHGRVSLSESNHHSPLVAVFLTAIPNSPASFQTGGWS